jgi:hypothetical protein
LQLAGSRRNRRADILYLCTADLSAMPKQSRSALLFASLAVVYLVWGSTYLAIHFVVDGIPGWPM